MQGIRTIAIGFDGSSDAKGAVLWGLNFAHDNDALVVVVHAKGLLARFEPTVVNEEIEASLAHVCDEVGVARSSVRLEVVDGDACSVMLRMAQPPVSADLLVVGTRGQSAHAGHLLGSTSLELAQHSPIPVVIVPRS